MAQSSNSMGIIIRQSIKGSFFSYLGVLIGAINLLYIYPQFLSREQIGIINSLEGISMVMSMLGSFGTFHIADRFFPFFKTEDQKHQGYFLFLAIYCVLGFILASFIFWLVRAPWQNYYFENSPDLIPYYYYIFLFTFSISFLYLGESYARINLRITIPNFFKEVVIRLIVTLSIFLFYLEWIDFATLVLFRIFAYLIAGILLIVYLRILGLKIFTFRPKFIKPKLLKQILTYGLYIVLGGASGQLIHRVDSIMIPAMMGTLDLGVYSIAFYIGSIIEIPRKMISSISMPIISQAWAENDHQELKNIYFKSSLNQLIIGLVFFLCVWINIDDLFSLIPKGDLFREGKYVVFFIGLTKLVDMSTGLNNEILVHSRLYRLTLVIVFMLAIFIIGTNLIFIPLYGLNGAAGATFLSYFIYNLVKFVIIWFAFKMQPLRGKHLLIVLIGLLAYYLAGLIPGSPWILIDIALKSAVICILTLGFVILANLSEDMRQLFDLALRIIRSFFRRMRS